MVHQNDSSAPATKGDFAELTRKLTVGFEELNRGFAEMKQRLNAMDAQFKIVLDLIASTADEAGKKIDGVADRLDSQMRLATRAMCGYEDRLRRVEDTLGLACPG